MSIVCKDCTKRTVGCHGKCKEYIEWRKEYDEMKSKIEKDRKADGFLISNENKRKGAMKDLRKKFTRAKYM